LLTFPDLFEDWFRTTGKRIVFDNKPLIVPARSMEEFLEGRKNEEAYTEFYERFLPCATMKMSWDRRIVVATSRSNPDFERNWLEEKKRSQAEMEARPKKRKCDREIALSDIFGSDHEEDHGTPTTDEAPVDDESDDED
jgi:hypothetical protein